ncbi:hypothetical protein D3C73_664500 [compost metagenome]
MTRVRTRISNQLILLIQPLQHIGSLFSREAQLLIRITLQFRQIIGERLWFELLRFDQLNQRGCFPLHLIDNTLCLVLLRDTSILLIAAPPFGLKSTQIGGHIPISNWLKAHNLTFSVHHHSQGRCLHPSC